MSLPALAELVADGVSVTQGSRVSIFTNDAAVLPAAAAFVEAIGLGGAEDAGGGLTAGDPPPPKPAAPAADRVSDDRFDSVA